MHLKTLLKLGGSLAILSSLSSCGGGGSSSTPAPTPTPTPTTPATLSVQAQISSAFAAIFDASATSDPVDPTEQSVPALAPAGTPIDF